MPGNPSVRHTGLQSFTEMLQEYFFPKQSFSLCSFPFLQHQEDFMSTLSPWFLRQFTEVLKGTRKLRLMEKVKVRLPQNFF